MLELNIKNRAVTQTTLAYNSLCRFGEHLLGANSNGLYALGGTTDHGIAIPVAFKTVTTDLGAINMKRFHYMVVGFRSSADLKVEVFINDTSIASPYTIPTQGNFMHRARIKIGLGAKGRYVAFKFTNTTGATFSIYGVDLFYSLLRNDAARTDD